MLPESVTTHVGGVRPDPFDRNDPKVKLVRSALVDLAAAGDEYSIPEFTPIGDQGPVGSCVANAWCDSLEMLLGLEEMKANPDETPQPTQLSRLFLYWASRCVTGDQKRDAGTYLRIAGQQLMKIGVCPETFWEYDISNLFVSPKLEQYNIASDNKIVGIYRIDSVLEDRCNDVETCVRADHPVVFSTGIGPEYQRYGGKGNAFTSPLHSIGLHAQIIVGVRRRADGKREYKVRNSWSQEWGDAGHAWINEEYLEWSSTTDLWFGTRMQELVL